MSYNSFDIRECQPGKSFFELRGKVWFAGSRNNNRPFHRLCSLMRKMGAVRVVVETLDIRKDCDIRQEIKALEIYYQSKDLNPTIFRLTFIRSEVASIEQLMSLDDSAFLASAIVINICPFGNNWDSYIWEAIVTLPHLFNSDSTPQVVPMLNNYYHVSKTFERHIEVEGGKITFNIRGSFFCQQNRATSVCAHAAIQTLVNNAFNLSTNNTLRSEEINQSLGIDHKLHKIDRGLNFGQMHQVLTKSPLNCRLKTIDFTKQQETNYIEMLHHLIESKCPCLLTFTTSRPDESHVVAVIGHTLNSDSWHPEAQLAFARERSRLNYLSSAQWIDHFIINDDQFGMYYCLAVNTLRKDPSISKDMTFRAGCLFAVVPSDGFEISPDQAEKIAVTTVRNLLYHLEKNNPNLFNQFPWFTEMKPTQLAPIVVRTALLNKDRYERHLRKRSQRSKSAHQHKDFLGNAFSTDQIKWIVQDLPNYFWLTEISLPDIFMANKNKLIDVIISKDSHGDSAGYNYNVLFIRLPGIGIKPNKNETQILNVTSHYPLFRVDPDLPTLEW